MKRRRFSLVNFPQLPHQQHTRGGRLSSLPSRGVRLESLTHGRVVKPALAMAGAVLLLALLLVGCGRGRAPQAQTAATATPVMVATAVEGPIQETVTLTGTAHGRQEVNVFPEFSGKVSAVYADVGDTIRQGQPLAQLDVALPAAQARQAQAQVGQASEGLKLTEAQTTIAVSQALQGLRLATDRLTQAQRSRDLTTKQVSSNTQQARLGLEHAQSTLRDVQSGSRSQEIAQANQALSQAQAAQRLSQANYNRYKQLFDNGAIAATQLDAAQTDLEVANSRVEQARQALDLTKSGARTEQVTMAEVGVQQAQQTLQLAQSGGQEQLAIAAREVSAAQVGVRQAQEGVTLAREGRRQVSVQQQGLRSAQAAASLAGIQVSKHTIYSPLTGLVAARSLTMGDTASSSPGMTDPAFRLVDLAVIKINCTVSELEVDRLHVGQYATLTVDGLGDRKFTGRVMDIAPQSNPSQRSFIARVELRNPDGAIKPGMFCRLQVIVGSQPRATLISRDSVVEEGTRRLIYAVVDGKIKVREIKLGASTDGLVEVLSGARPGDVLVVTGQSLLADGQSVKPTERAQFEAEGQAAVSTTAPTPSSPSQH